MPCSAHVTRQPSPFAAGGVPAPGGTHVCRTRTRRISLYAAAGGWPAPCGQWVSKHPVRTIAAAEHAPVPLVQPDCPRLAQQEAGPHLTILAWATASAPPSQQA